MDAFQEKMICPDALNIIILYSQDILSYLSQA